MELGIKFNPGKFSVFVPLGQKGLGPEVVYVNKPAVSEDVEDVKDGEVICLSKCLFPG